MSLRHAFLPGLASVLLAPACVIHVPCCDSGLVVDGVTLDEKHEENLELGPWHPSGLTIESSLGDLAFEPTDGPSRVIATLHEAELGDAYLVHEEGKLGVRSFSGEPVALGDAHVYVNGELPALTVSTGMGDVHVHGIGIAGACSLETGMGTLSLADVHAGGEATLTSGMGDVEVEGVHSARITAESGMGNVILRHVTTGDADLSSGMGDIELDGSAFNILQAETGLGNVECRESTYVQRHLESGLGSVDG